MLAIESQKIQCGRVLTLDPVTSPTDAVTVSESGSLKSPV